MVRTQGRALTVRSLLHTAAVEHGPHRAQRVRVRLVDEGRPQVEVVDRALDGLAGEPAPDDWSDVRYVLVGTGRAALTDDEREQLGGVADHFPLLG